MSYYELFQQGPAVYIPVLFIDLTITLLAYGAVPIVFAKIRKEKITRIKYDLICYGVNFFVMIFFVAINGSSASGGPYILWTFVFSEIGKRILKKRGLLETKLKKDKAVQVVKEIAQSNGDQQKTEVVSMTEHDEVLNDIEQAEEQVNESDEPVIEKAEEKTVVEKRIELPITANIVEIRNKDIAKRKKTGQWKNVAIAILSIVALGAIFFGIYQYEELEKKNIALEIWQKIDEIHYEELIWYQENCGIVVIGNEYYYHIRGICDATKADQYSYRIYNVEAAEHYGYKPCPICYDGISRY